MKSVTIDVKDMHCINCAMKLQVLEDDLPGVITVDASYRNQCMTVVYDDSLVNLNQILGAVKDLGYSPELTQ
ncbi:MAG: hypothetical protein C0401_04465 [Anaerolinea sp.]|nr:hypothetical protein [Anaerolinea sp.]